MLPVCKELPDQNRHYAGGECPVFERLFLKTDKNRLESPRYLTFHSDLE